MASLSSYPKYSKTKQVRLALVMGMTSDYYEKMPFEEIEMSTQLFWLHALN